MIRVATNILLILLFSFSSLTLFGQEDEKNKIVLETKRGVTDEAGKKLAGVKVTIKKNGAVIQTITTSSNGQFPKVELPMGNVYEFEFSKPDYVNISIVFDVKKGYFPDDFPEAGITQSVEATTITMYRSVPNVDYSIISSKPRAKGGFISGNLDWDDVYINSRKNEIDAFLDRIEGQLKKIEEEFNNLIKQGDQAMSTGGFSQAIELYKNALKIHPESALVKNKITAAEQKIKEKEEEERKQKEFDKIMAEGDALLASDKLDEAITKYKSGLTILPLSKIPAQKIAEVEKRRKELELIALKQKVDALIKEGDRLFADNKWEESKAKYQEALTLKNDEAYPKQQIVKIDQILAEIKKKEAEFVKLVSEGDQAFSIQQFDNSIAKYQQALAIFPDKQEVKDKIAKAEEAKRRKEELERKEKQYTELMASGETALTSKQYDNAISLFQQAQALFSDRPLPKEKITLAQQLKQKEEEERKRKEQFNALIDQADKQFAASTFEKARDTYNEALKLFPSDAYAKKRYDESVQKIREIEEEKRRLAEIEKKYNDFISQGNDFKNTEKYTEALSAYNQALGVKPNDAVANQKIAEVKKLIEQKEAERQKRVKYEALVNDGTRLFNSNDYQNAINKYKEASALYPNESYPKDQIAIAEKKLIEKQEEERRLAEEKKKKDDYNNFIAQADDRFNAKSYQESISFYQKAQAIFPSNPYAGDKIKEAERQLRLIAEEEAKKKSQSEREAEFKRLIEQGDQLVSQQEFENAKIAYNNALALNDTPEVRKKIADVDKLIAENNAKKQKEEEQKNIDLQYNKLVAEADKAFESGDYNGAKLAYQKALTYKSGESYPKTKIKEIDDYLKKELENKGKEFAEQQKKQQFQSLLKSGDDALGTKNFSGAINFYKEAQKIYPNDATVQTKIDAAQKQWDQEKSNLASGDNEKQKREQYNNAITLADKAFSEGNYDRAMSKYQEAQTYLPNETYPSNQIELINKKKQELANQNNANESQIKYNDFISKANSYRDAKDYNSAISYYQQALGVKPGDAFANAEINRINKTLGEQSKEQQYKDIITRADAALTQKSYSSAISQYQQALSVKPNDSYANQKIREANRLIELEKETQTQQQVVTTTQQQTTNTNTQVQTTNTNTNQSLINIGGGYKQVEMSEEEILAAMEQSVDDNNYTRPQIIENTENENLKRQYNNQKIQQENSNTLSKQYEDLDPSSTLVNWEEKQRIVTSNQYDSNLEYETKKQEDLLVSENRRDYMLAEHERISDNNVRRANDVSSTSDIKRNNINGQYTNIETDRMQEELVSDFRREGFIAEVNANDQKNTESTYNKSQQDIEQNLVVSETLDEIETQRLSENLDADESRILNNERLEDFNQQTIEIENERKEKSTALSLANTEAFEDIETRRMNEAIENDEPRQQVIDEYEKYDDQRTNLFNDYNEKSKEKSLKSVQELSDNETKNQEMALNKDEHRLNANSELAIYQEEALQTSVDIQSRNKVSTEENSKAFEEDKTEQAYKDLKADERRNRAIEDGKNVEQANTETTNNQTYFAQQKTQTINEQLDKAETQKAEENLQGIASQDDNSASINQYTDQNTTTTTKQQKTAENRSQAVDDQLDENASKSPTYMSDQTTDNLALKYPEGVTEERFTTESNGAVTGYIIVRIVVKGNKGDEYKKSVTKQMTRFFKNGVPITEDVWDRETQVSNGK